MKITKQTILKYRLIQEINILEILLLWDIRFILHNLKSNPYYTGLPYHISSWAPISKYLLISNFFISFQIFKEGGPSASADFQGAHRLHYNIILIKKKKT